MAAAIETIRETLRARRDRLLTSPRFRALATAFWPTRLVARRRAAALFDLCAGFVYSQVLWAVVRLRLLERLALGPAGVDELACATGLPAEGLERLLLAAAGLGLVERRTAGRWGLGSRGAEVLATPGLSAMIEHHALVYADLADPVRLLRRPPGAARLARYWPYASALDATALSAERVGPYSALMAATQPMVAAEILAVWPLRGVRRLLDVGGGEGAFLAAVAARFPRLELVLFDLPAVAERARARLAAAGLAERVEIVGGDFRQDPLPTGCDGASLVRILHDHDEATVLDLLRAVRTALVPGGRVLVAEPLAETPGAERVGAYFALYLAAMGRGRPRRAEELVDLLERAGFVRPRLHRTRLPLVASVVSARRS
ncbi:MAG: methyltransferase [Geminicoccaceae bacterium]|nr:methyltransferase [Geminicoccaceae bacterium]